MIYLLLDRTAETLEKFLPKAIKPGVATLNGNSVERSWQQNTS